MMIRFLSACALLACATPAFAKDHMMDATFIDPVPATVASAPVSCKITFTSLKDERETPDLVGTFFEDELQPPADRAAWIKSMMEGLNRRGFDVRFGEAPPEYHPMGVALTTLWSDLYNGAFNATVKFRITSADLARPFDRTLRGSFSRTLFMATVQGRSNEAVHGAVANALDRVADALLGWCGGKPA